jgi:hypothetical protein
MYLLHTEFTAPHADRRLLSDLLKILFKVTFSGMADTITGIKYKQICYPHIHPSTVKMEAAASAENLISS